MEPFTTLLLSPWKLHPLYLVYWSKWWTQFTTLQPSYGRAEVEDTRRRKDKGCDCLWLCQYSVMNVRLCNFLCLQHSCQEFMFVVHVSANHRYSMSIHRCHRLCAILTSVQNVSYPITLHLFITRWR